MNKKYFIALVVVVISLLLVNIFFLINNKDCSCKQKKQDKENVSCNCYVTEKLSLDKEQAYKYSLIKKKHQTIALKAIDSLHVSQELLMDYLASNSDSVKIAELENKITESQKILLRHHIEQYQDLKAILRPEQMGQMNILFKSLFVCKPSCEHNHKEY